MTYIILAGGKGANLYPLTLKYPKTSYTVNGSETILQRLVRGIRAFENDAEIVVVLGYRHKQVRQSLESENVICVINPFYEVTNSITSLWFAKDYLERENVAIIHGDVVYSERIISEIITKPTKRPFVLVDSSVHEDGHYNAVINGNKVLVMSRKMEKYDSRYACASKLDPVTSRLLKEKINSMVMDNMYDQFYEDALVQMIMFDDLELGYKDIAGQRWCEVDSVDDLLSAKFIAQEESRQS